jgi:hypothetical protein
LGVDFVLMPRTEIESVLVCLLTVPYSIFEVFDSIRVAVIRLIKITLLTIL